jgi:fructose-1,6-bisphosphatase I
MAQTANSDFVVLMNAIATACKLVSRSTRKAGIAGLYGLAGSENATGDDQKKLDVLSNDMFVNALYNSGVCAVLVSEEDDEPIIVTEAKSGRYCVAFDPLDGSSNIDCNVSTGTIFSVWEKTDSSAASVSDILRAGKDMVCAG